MTTPPLKGLPELPHAAQARTPRKGAKAKMQARVRVMPAVIIAIVCLLAAKGLDLTRHFAEAATTAEKAAPKAKDEKSAAKGANAEVDSAIAAAAADMDAGATPADAASDAPVTPDLKLAEAVPQPGSLGGGAPAAGNVCPGPSVAEQAGLSASEAQVLQSLSDRRKTLEGRGEELSTREQLLLSAEKRIEQRLAELKALQTRVQSALGGLDEKADQDTAALVRVYEKMKPKAAAAVMETLDDDVSLRVARRMKEASLAVILSNMQPARAKHLTELMAKRVDNAKVAAENAVTGADKAKAKPAAKPAAPKKTASAAPAAAAPSTPDAAAAPAPGA